MAMVDPEKADSTKTAQEKRKAVVVPAIPVLEGYAFEDYLKKLFYRLGYDVMSTKLIVGKGAALILLKDEKRTVVKAKNYKGKVTNKAVQEILAAKKYYKADKSMVVTNSSFTRNAVALGLRNSVELWDGYKLKEMVKKCQ